MFLIFLDFRHRYEKYVLLLKETQIIEAIDLKSQIAYSIYALKQRNKG